MKNEERKANPYIKWTLYGVLVAMCAVIIAFHADIFDPNSYLKTFDSPNGFIKYVMNNGISNLCQSVLIVGIAVTLGIILSFIARISFKSKKGKTLSKLIVNFLKWVIAICSVFFIISAWGASTTITLASAGILTLIIGLGSQSLVADILAGLFIVFEGDFQVGDIVVIDGWRGEVLEIGIRTTRLMDAGGNIKIVSNNEIKSIINQTQELSIAKCYVGVSYGARIEKIESVIADNIETMKERIPAIVEGPYYKGVSELGESSVVLLFLAKCKEDDIYQVQRDMNREIKIMFDNNGIEIPFNQVVVHMENDEGTNEKVSQRVVQKADNFNDEQKELSKDLDDKK